MKQIFLLALAGTLAFSSCSEKKDDAAAPSFGSITVGSTNTNLQATFTTTDDGYALVGSDNADTSKASLFVVAFFERKPAAGTYSIGDTAGSSSFLGVVTGSGSRQSSTSRLYFKDDEKATVTVTGGKVKVSFNNLTETGFDGRDVAGRPTITGSLTEK
jgi:hypothetical protein